MRNSGIDSNWTLFLDRDGVINRRIEGDYVREWKQFEFLPLVVEAIERLSGLFGKLIVVTNQRGVARDLVRVSDLAEIHEKMIEKIAQCGGRIDGVYVCPHGLEAHCDCRKPGVGLALQAKRDFPSVDFSRSIMVGDDISDIAFAANLNMRAVLVGDKTNAELRKDLSYQQYGDLFEFARSLFLGA